MTKIPSVAPKPVTTARHHTSKYDGKRLRPKIRVKMRHMSVRQKLVLRFKSGSSHVHKSGVKAEANPTTLCLTLNTEACLFSSMMVLKALSHSFNCQDCFFEAHQFDEFFHIIFHTGYISYFTIKQIFSVFCFLQNIDNCITASLWSSLITPNFLYFGSFEHVLSAYSDFRSGKVYILTNFKVPKSSKKGYVFKCLKDPFFFYSSGKT